MKTQIFNVENPTNTSQPIARRSLISESSRSRSSLDQRSSNGTKVDKDNRMDDSIKPEMSAENIPHVHTSCKVSNFYHLQSLTTRAVFKTHPYIKIKKKGIDVDRKHKMFFIVIKIMILIYSFRRTFHVR